MVAPPTPPMPRRTPTHRRPRVPAMRPSRARRPMPDAWRRDRVGSALRGENPTVLRRLTGGFAVMGDVQFLPGYSVLITDTLGADRLTDLPRPQRLTFLADVELLG